MKEIKFEENGNMVLVHSFNNDQVKDNLKPRIYTVRFSKPIGFYLEVNMDLFSIPNRVYGNTMERVDKIYNTFTDRTKSTSVLMTGKKGSGKTLLAEIMCNHMIGNEYPVLLINDSFAGDDFNEFIDKIGPCVLFFDEFGKNYYNPNHKNDNSNQDSLLTLLDGTMNPKRLVLLTENNQWRINEYMLNRPGRIFYHFKYDKLNEYIITEYCNDKNVPTEPTQDIIDIARMVNEFSFDILKGIVEEYTRYGHPIDDIIRDLNIVTEKESKWIMQVTRVMLDNKNILSKPVTIDLPTKHNSQCIDLDVNTLNADKTQSSDVVMLDDDRLTDLWVGKEHLKYQDGDDMVYEVSTGWGDVVVIGKKKLKSVASGTYYRNLF
jgi:hypothetical protein